MIEEQLSPPHQRFCLVSTGSVVDARRQMHPHLSFRPSTSLLVKLSPGGLVLTPEMEFQQGLARSPSLRFCDREVKGSRPDNTYLISTRRFSSSDLHPSNAHMVTKSSLPWISRFHSSGVIFWRRMPRVPTLCLSFEAGHLQQPSWGRLA